LAAARGLAWAVQQRLTLPSTFVPNVCGEVGAVIYVLARLSEWLAEPPLIDEAQGLADRITPTALAADKRLSVASGAAGALLGLLALHHATGDPTRLSQATACGQHLLDQRGGEDDNHQGWSDLPRGLAHGVDGVAYALLRLAEHKPKFRAPALAALSDVRQDATINVAAGWGDGSVEIGLARLGMLTVMDDPDIRDDFEEALGAVKTAPPTVLDHLCGGNFGLLEMLLAAAQHGGYPEMEVQVQEEASRLVAQAGPDGDFRLFGEPVGNVYNAGFGRGMAGIGYQLLRMADPSALPSALLWW